MQHHLPVHEWKAGSNYHRTIHSAESANYRLVVGISLGGPSQLWNCSSKSSKGRISWVYSVFSHAQCLYWWVRTMLASRITTNYHLTPYFPPHQEWESNITARFNAIATYPSEELEWPSNTAWMVIFHPSSSLGTGASGPKHLWAIVWAQVRLHSVKSWHLDPGTN